MRRHAPLYVAIAALLTAILGSAPVGQAAWEQVLPRNSVGSAHIQSEAVHSGHVRNGSLQAADFRSDQLPREVERMWAVVDAAGSTVSGENVVSSRRVLTGIYTVTFNRRTASCAVLATQRSADNGYASARPGGAGVSSVTVNLYATGTAIQRFNGAFSVAVLCQPSPTRR
jgi:hypothetical protein